MGQSYSKLGVAALAGAAIHQLTASRGAALASTTGALVAAFLLHPKLFGIAPAPSGWQRWLASGEQNTYEMGCEGKLALKLLSPNEAAVAADRLKKMKQQKMLIEPRCVVLCALRRLSSRSAPPALLLIVPCVRFLAIGPR